MAREVVPARSAAIVRGFMFGNVFYAYFFFFPFFFFLLSSGSGGS
jgi:hypothetical protein